MLINLFLMVLGSVLIVGLFGLFLSIMYCLWINNELRSNNELKMNKHNKEKENVK